VDAAILFIAALIAGIFAVDPGEWQAKVKHVELRDATPVDRRALLTTKGRA
jgi:hypothetical protein